MNKIIKNVITHTFAIIFGFGLGIYSLPILTAPESPEASVIQSKAQDALYTAKLTRDLKGSDFFHWGDGTISITPTHIVHEGSLAPGPDYKLYLVNEFVEHEDQFLPIKDSAQYIGDIKSFNGFVLDIPDGVNIADYNTVLVWCESFSEFITSAKYKEVSKAFVPVAHADWLSKSS